MFYIFAPNQDTPKMPSSVTIHPVIREQEKKKDGTYPIRFRVTFKRKQKFISTNLVAEQRQLTRMFTIKDPILDETVNNLLRGMRKVVNGIDPFSLDGMDVGDVVKLIERGMSEGEGFRLDFPTYFEKIASEKKKSTLKSTQMSALHALTAFLGTEHFDISVISSSMMRKFERHLIEKHGEGARAVSMYTKTIAHVHRRAQEEFNNEESDEVLIKNPFAYYKCPRQKPSEHRNIDAEIIRKMISMREDLRGRERLGVDLFLISFALMGMNTPDIYKCSKPKNGIIVYNRTKTCEHRDDKAEMHVRMEPCLEKLFSEYKGWDGKHLFMFHNRYSTFENLGRAANVGLKKFSERIGVPKIDVYSARHSWGTIARGLRIEKATVNDCLCHVDEAMRTTDIYIKKDWSILWEANAKVLALFDWPV
ncbi:MAG: hypothetical protein IKH15_12030 [Bacteroidales bacterium]|nr:hypothetical protein [Bacteroidales bacterium]